MNILQKFLNENRKEILALSEEKTRRLAGILATSEQLELGLPLFFDQLIKVLEQRIGSHPEDLISDAASHGKECLRLGYSISHVVHAYGAMCQAITELATMKNAKISSSDFNILNGCLDAAIAAAVSEFQFRSNEANEEREVKNLGFLAHELRSALASAATAHEMIKAGLVGTGGSTSRVLEANLVRMRNLIDRSLCEVRMRSDADLYIEKFRLSDLLDQIIVTARIDAVKRNQTLVIETDWKIEIEADRQFILASIANLIQNAIKYTKSNGKIYLRAKISGSNVLIQVEDECGGIETEKISSLFEPYVQENADRSGLGLGLAIAQRAIHLSQGKITVRNNPGIGCAFIIEIPQKLTPIPFTKSAVPGKDSVQPNFKRKS